MLRASLELPTASSCRDVSVLGLEKRELLVVSELSSNCDVERGGDCLVVVLFCLISEATGVVDAGRASKVVREEAVGPEAIAKGLGAGNGFWEDSPKFELELGAEEGTRRDTAPEGPR